MFFACSICSRSFVVHHGPVLRHAGRPVCASCLPSGEPTNIDFQPVCTCDLCGRPVWSSPAEIDGRRVHAGVCADRLRAAAPEVAPISETRPARRPAPPLPQPELVDDETPPDLERALRDSLTALAKRPSFMNTAAARHAMARDLTAPLPSDELDPHERRKASRIARRGEPTRSVSRGLARGAA